jgi:predicted DNA-binding protein (UPF0251 family)
VIKAAGDIPAAFIHLIGGNKMSRPRKRKRVCSLPKNNRFGPIGGSVDGRETVIMTIEEYETIRIIDLEGKQQQECAEQMGVARTTVQGIYDTARKKLADSLVNGKPIFINGGDYILCGDIEEKGGGGKHRRRRGRSGGV